MQSPVDIDTLNAELRDASAEQIVCRALELSERPLLTTSFAPNAAVMLHLVTRLRPAIPVLWVDSGYNVPDTYRVAEQLIEQLDLNMQVFIPAMTAERRNTLLGGIPHPDDDPELHLEFTRQVKLEPFERALETLQPDLWLTGIRREETAFRRSLDIASRDARGMLKIAPVFYWSEDDIVGYMARHDLPSCRHYFDPTKVADNRECGLHTAA